MNENEEYVRKMLPVKENRAMAKVFGNAKLFSGTVALMKSNHDLAKPMKYPMLGIRNFLFAPSYLINHRLCDLKQSVTQV